MLRITKLNWQEPSAYTAAVATGLYWGVSCDPAWLSRAGSVVIVCGVLLAASRKIELLQAKVSGFLANHSTAGFDAILSEHQNADGTPIGDKQDQNLGKH